ncbi:hypothetical protein [Photobacterium leiognathi]|uniref:hypothetical protein n=1 Tax=Photobacterium leiognathi TaxID=553611 RepID=UPI0029816AF6|nr:hypothetical protein [Photobacterium leiognathi]
MNKIEMVKSTNISELSEKHSDFESLFLSVKSYKSTLKTKELNTTLESDFFDMVFKEAFIADNIRKIKTAKERLREIIDED